MNEINFLEFEIIYFEIKSLFFCLIKRTKNQGFGIVVKAQISRLSNDSRSEALYFVRSLNADFVGDLTCPKIGLHKKCKNEKRK
jgi:hypothetical protein